MVSKEITYRELPEDIDVVRVLAGAFFMFASLAAVVIAANFLSCHCDPPSSDKPLSIVAKNWPIEEELTIDADHDGAYGGTPVSIGAKPCPIPIKLRIPADGDEAYGGSALLKAIAMGDKDAVHALLAKNTTFMLPKVFHATTSGHLQRVTFAQMASQLGHKDIAAELVANGDYNGHYRPYTKIVEEVLSAAIKRQQHMAKSTGNASTGFKADTTLFKMGMVTTQQQHVFILSTRTRRRPSPAIVFNTVVNVSLMHEEKGKWDWLKTGLLVAVVLLALIGAIHLFSVLGASDDDDAPPTEYPDDYPDDNASSHPIGHERAHEPNHTVTPA